jgi:O-antigen/teichoic acid export membrane protein
MRFLLTDEGQPGAVGASAPEGYSLVRNTFAQSGPLMLGYFYSFAAAPIIVAGLGLRQFGIWALTGALAQYGSLLDLGVGRSLSRYIAAYSTNRLRCGEYMTVGFLSVAIVGAPLGVAAVFGAAPLSALLGGISPHDMRIVLVSSVVLLLCSMLASVISAYPIGLRRMVAPNVGLAVGATINFAASVGAIWLGASLPGYALANAGAGVLTVIVVAAIVLSTEGWLPLAAPNGGRTRQFIVFAFRNQVVRAMELVNYQSDKIVVALAVSPTAAGAYELANRVALAARQIGVYPTTALVPVLSAEHARFGLREVRARYGRLAEVTVAIAFPSLWLTAAIGPLLLGAWLAQVPPDSEAILLVLSLAYLANVSSGVAYAMTAALGNPTIAASTSVATALLNIVLTAGLAPFYGLWGVLAGTAFALTAGAVAQVVMIHRAFHLQARAYWAAVISTTRVCLLLALPVFAVAYGNVITGRLSQALAVVILSLAYVTLYSIWAIRQRRFPRSLIARVPRFRWAQAPG